jgi:tetratricopeptide (TPR) repeat protein
MNHRIFFIGATAWALLGGGVLPVLPTQAQDATPPKAGAKVDPDAAAKALLEIVKEGELRIDGKISALLGPGVWQIEATSWTSPRGVTTDFDEPKNKGVKVGAETNLHPRGELSKVALKDVKLGSRVAVIGKNGPEGTIIAREVVLLEGYGSRKTVGSVTINQFTSQMVRQSREARDAGLLPKALNLAEKAIATAQGMGDVSGEALATQDKALLLLELEQPEQAFNSFKRVESLGRASGNSVMMSLGMRGAASMMMSSGRVKEAISLLREADPISANTEQEIRLSVLSTLASAYMLDDNLTDAISVLQRIHPIEQGLGKEADAGETLLMIALLQADERPDLAREALTDAAARIERARDDKAKAGLIGAAALVKWRLGDKEEAQEGFTTAATRFNELGDERSSKRWASMPTALEGMEDTWQAYWAVLMGRGIKAEAEGNNEGKYKEKEATPPGDDAQG